MTSSFTIDTNILIYASDSANAAKRSVARSIIARMSEAESILPLQCLNEFNSATTKKGLLTPTAAERIVQQALKSFQIVVPHP